MRPAYQNFLPLSSRTSQFNLDILCLVLIIDDFQRDRERLRSIWRGLVQSVKHNLDDWRVDRDVIVGCATLLDLLDLLGCQINESQLLARRRSQVDRLGQSSGGGWLVSLVAP